MPQGFKPRRGVWDGVTKVGSWKMILVGGVVKLKVAGKFFRLFFFIGISYAKI